MVIWLYVCMLCYRWLSTREGISHSKTGVLMSSLGVEEISTYVQSIINDNIFG